MDGIVSDLESSRDYHQNVNNSLILTKKYYEKIILFAAIVSTTLTSCETAQQVLKGIGDATGTGGLSNYEIVSGLKEAISVGTQNSSQQLSNLDGFFKNAAIKILMPEEAKK